MEKQRYQQEQKDGDYVRAVQGISAEDVKRRVEGKSETQGNVLDALRPRNREQDDAREVNDESNRSKETERSKRNQGNDSDEERSNIK